MGIFDSNYLAQLSDINAQLNNQSLTDDQRGILKSAKRDAVMSMGLTGLQGGLQLANQFVTDSRGADTSMYDAALADMSVGRGHNTFDNTQLLNYSSTIPGGFKADVDDLNKTRLQSAMSIGSSALSGGFTGAQIGGVPGAIIGAGAGLLLGYGADARARNINAQKVNLANAAQTYENGMNTAAIQSNADIAKQTMFGTQYGQRKANGGFLKNYTQDDRQFIRHSHCKGGTLVRIKAK